MPKRIKVYLAGPVTGCNRDQQVKWRKDIKRGLQKAGFESLDPTTETARKGALAVAADIEEADVVIANMWKESIGTVLGIVHAQRLGIPVILIDRNYLNSPVLEALVDQVVRDEDAAVNYLTNELLKGFQRTIVVRKKNQSGSTKEEAFSPAKLQRSLKASCTHAGIDDPVFCTMLFQRVKRSIFNSSDGKSIPSETIRSLIFQEITNLSSEVPGLHQADQTTIQQHATTMKQIWEDYEFNKEVHEEQSALEGMYIDEIESLGAEIAQLRLRLLFRTNNFPSKDDQEHSVAVSLASQLQSLLANRRALCIRRIGRGSFQNAFERLGLPGDDFVRFFVEEERDGKQSNLNKYLKGAITQYSYVLYAGEDLRHISDPAVGSAENFIRGYGVNDAIRRLLSK